MKRASRPKPSCVPGAANARRAAARLFVIAWPAAISVLALLLGPVRAQAPLASSYATRDGRVLSYVQACASTDGTFTAQPCGVSGFPVHVTVDAPGSRSAAWTDASFTATASATTPSALAAVAARAGLHVWNLGTVTVCLNYSAMAVASGGGCAVGSVPIPAGSAYLEDQAGNVSPEAISLVCAGASCPLTIKVR